MEADILWQVSVVRFGFFVFVDVVED